jgi:preprotein translocase subunit YajC
MNILASLALSPSQGGDPSSQMLSTVIMFGSIMVIFYFMILRPQKKRETDQKKLLEAIKKGDKIVMSSGIHGTVFDVETDVVVVQIADNVRVRVNKAAVNAVTPKADKIEKVVDKATEKIADKVEKSDK